MPDTTFTIRLMRRVNGVDFHSIIVSQDTDTAEARDVAFAQAESRVERLIKNHDPALVDPAENPFGQKPAEAV